MNSHLTPIVLLALLFPRLSGAALEGAAWERVYQDSSLLVERRAYAGSALNEIRGVTTVHASLNAIMALLKDADANQEWVYRSGGARIVQQNGYSQAYVYGVVDAPWPMRDRDTVVRFDYRQQPDTLAITITITAFPEFVPTVDRYVRVPDFGGFWQLQPLDGGWVKVSYQVYGDPGGWIPVWVANYAAQLSVTRTLQNMGAAVAGYAGARSEFVRELAASETPLR